MGGVVKWLLAKGLGAFGYKNKKFVRSLRSHNQNSQGPTPTLQQQGKILIG